MQCLLVFLVLLCIFVGVVCLVLCGTKNTLLATVTIMPSSHNIVVSLCCYSVDRFIPTVAILRYYCKPALNIVVRKLCVVGTCKP